MSTLRPVIACAVLLLALPVGATAQQDAGPTWQIRRAPSTQDVPVTIEPALLEFGNIMPESRSGARVALTNTGDVPLRIAGVRTTCWCTAGTPDRSEIGPGDTAHLDVEVEAPDMMGELGRRIFVTFEGFSRPVSIGVHADVNRGIEARIRYDPPDQQQRGVLELRSTDGSPFAILSTNFGAPAQDGRASEWSFPFDLSSRSTDRADRWLLVETDHATAPIVDVLAAGRFPPRSTRPPLVFSRDRIYAGAVRPGDTLRRTIVMTGKWDAGEQDIRLFRVDGSFGARIVESRHVDQGLELTLEIDAADDAEGIVFAGVHVRTGDGRRGSFVIVGRAVPAG